MLEVFRWLARLPLAVLQWAAGLLGWFAWWLSPVLRRRTRANLRLAQAATAGDELPIVASDRLARAATVHSARMIGELPWIWFRPLAEVAGKVTCVDLPVMEAAEGQGRGVIFITPHIGSFDAAARWYAQRLCITVLFKPPKQPLLQPVIRAARSGERMSAAPASVAGLRMCVRALRSGSAVAILPDQVPTAGDGRWVDYFGRPAYTMTLPQRLAEMTGAAIVLVHCERLGHGEGWRLRAQRLVEVPTPEVLNAAMQRLVAQCPEQYLWSYNRYKRPAGVAEHGAPQR